VTKRPHDKKTGMSGDNQRVAREFGIHLLRDVAREGIRKSEAISYLGRSLLRVNFRQEALRESRVSV